MLMSLALHHYPISQKVFRVFLNVFLAFSSAEKINLNCLVVHFIDNSSIERWMSQSAYYILKFIEIAEISVLGHLKEQKSFHVCNVFFDYSWFLFDDVWKLIVFATLGCPKWIDLDNDWINSVLVSRSVVM